MARAVLRAALRRSRAGIGHLGGLVGRREPLRPGVAAAPGDEPDALGRHRPGVAQPVRGRRVERDRVARPEVVGLEPDGKDRQQSCLPSGISSLHDRERWHRASIWKSVYSEKEFEAALLPLAVVEGISVDEPFPFLLYGHVVRATGRFFCKPDHLHGADQSKTAKSRFSIAEESVEIIGFFSVNHLGLLSPPDSPFHMHLRTMDNRISGHLEAIQWDHGFVAELPAKER